MSGLLVSSLPVEGDKMELSLFFLDDKMELSTLEESPIGKSIKRMLKSGYVNGKWDEVVKLCEENPWASKARITGSGDTILHLAVYSGVRKETLEELARSNSHEAFATENARGDTPLHVAASMGNVALCQSILPDNFYCNYFYCNDELMGIRNREGESPLFSAVLNGKMEAVLWLAHFLRYRDVYKFLRRDDGSTILHCAIAGDYFGESTTEIYIYLLSDHEAS